MQCAVASAACAAASRVSAPAKLAHASVILDDMKEQVGSLVSVHSGDNEDLSKDERVSVKVELDGFVGDKHRSFERVAWPGD